MFNRKYDTTLQETIKATYTRFQQSHPEAAEVLFDRHFVGVHLAPVLQQRLKGGCPADVNWVAKLWAAHLGVPEQVLNRQLPEISPTIAAFLRQLRLDLQAKGGNSAISRLVGSN